MEEDEIIEVVLYVSTTSQPSMHAISYASSIGLHGIRILRLDNQKVRDIVSNGKYIQVKEVPTLSVLYSDTTVHLYKGYAKCKWFMDMLKSRQIIEDEEDEYDEYMDDEYSEREVIESKDNPLLLTKKNGGETKMSDVKQKAQEMENMRRKALGE